MSAMTTWTSFFGAHMAASADAAQATTAAMQAAINNRRRFMLFILQATGPIPAAGPVCMSSHCELGALDPPIQLQPLVVPQLSHFRHVPLRTSVN